MELELWAKIPGYENYQISSFGNVMNLKSGKILKPFDRCKGKKLLEGYLTVHLGKPKGKLKNTTIHSLMMLAFVGKRPKGMVINHINGIRSCNRLWNLEYCTQSENRKQDFIFGRQSLKGEKNTQAKLSEKEVLQILELYNAGGQTYASLANKFNVHRSGISNIFNGHCWSYLTGIKNGVRTKRRG